MEQPRTPRWILEEFLKQYLCVRDLDATMELMAEQVCGFGPHREQATRSRAQLEELLRREYRCDSELEEMRYSVTQYREVSLGQQAWGVFAGVLMELRLPGHTDRTRVETRLSLMLCGQPLCIAGMHFSVAGSRWDERDFFPLHYILHEQQKIDLNAQKKLAAIMADMVPGGLMGGYLEKGLPLYFINDELLRYLDYSYKDFIRATGGMLANIVHPDDLKMVKDAIYAGLEHSGSYEISYRMQKRDGDYLWVSGKGKEIAGYDGRQAFISVVMDISESIHQQQRLEREAAYDPLTGIYNRRKAIELVNHIAREGRPGAFCMIDIDNFKEANDIYGHVSGDQILQELADILKHQTRHSDIVARIGGDEFIVYFYDAKDREVILRRVEYFCQLFRDYNQENYPKSRLSLSVGVLYSEGQNQPFGALYERADKLLYEVKKQGKHGVRMLCV